MSAEAGSGTLTWSRFPISSSFECNQDGGVRIKCGPRFRGARPFRVEVSRHPAEHEQWLRPRETLSIRFRCVAEAMCFANEAVVFRKRSTQ